MYTIRDFAMLTPMKYYNNEAESQKRSDMINNKDNQYIATVKKDGDWAMLIHYSNGNNLIRSRSISKVTGEYGDYTEKLPHIVDYMNGLPDSTVLLAELCWDEPGTNANTVGTILRCLPPKAVERQKEKKLKAVVFDCLMVGSEDFTNLPYISRLLLIEKYLKEHPSSYVYLTQICELDNEHENFLVWADEIINNGGEGLVIQNKNNPYMPGTRTAWKTLKLKQSLPEMELKVVNVIRPNRDYDGKDKEHWCYWEIFTGQNTEDPDTGEITDIYELVYSDNANTQKELAKYAEPVTKPYYYGWMNGVKVIDNNENITSVTSGLTDDDRQWLAQPSTRLAIAHGEIYAVVRAMSINDKGALRHPYLVRFRDATDGAGEK